MRHWEITREKGALKFILQDGMLRWGLLMFLITFYMPSGRRFSILVTACIWATAGAVLGAFVWIISERQYKNFLAQKTKPIEA
jgi:hypothetical protein